MWLEHEKKGWRAHKDSILVDLALKMYESKEYSIPQILKASKLSKTTFYVILMEGRTKYGFKNHFNSCAT